MTKTAASGDAPECLSPDTWQPGSSSPLSKHALFWVGLHNKIDKFKFARSTGTVEDTVKSAKERQSCWSPLISLCKSQSLFQSEDLCLHLLYRVMRSFFNRTLYWANLHQVSSTLRRLETPLPKQAGQSMSWIPGSSGALYARPEPRCIASVGRLSWPFHEVPDVLSTIAGSPCRQTKARDLNAPTRL